ncbi:MAG: hypothetical protein ABI824_16555 [Acidobacteriota bacterium]
MSLVMGTVVLVLGAAVVIGIAGYVVDRCTASHEQEMEHKD